MSGIVQARSSDECEDTITLRQYTATFNIFQFDTPLYCRYLDVISSSPGLQSGDSEYCKLQKDKSKKRLQLASFSQGTNDSTPGRLRYMNIE